MNYESNAQLLRDRFDVALQALLWGGFVEGVEKGLDVATKMRGWLTRLPDSKRQREVREWADKAIQDLRDSIASKAPR